MNPAPHAQDLQNTPAAPHPARETWATELRHLEAMTKAELTSMGFHTRHRHCRPAQALEDSAAEWARRIARVSRRMPYIENLRERLGLPAWRSSYPCEYRVWSDQVRLAQGPTEKDKVEHERRALQEVATSTGHRPVRWMRGMIAYLTERQATAVDAKAVAHAVKQVEVLLRAKLHRAYLRRNGLAR